MRRFLFGLTILLLARVANAAPPGVMRTNVSLSWTYPTNELSTNLTFKVYSSTNISIALTNWPVLTTVAGTNTSVTLPINLQQQWFVMTASNWFGESVFSSVAEIPAPPRSVNLQLGP